MKSVRKPLETAAFVITELILNNYEAVVSKQGRSH